MAKIQVTDVTSMMLTEVTNMNGYVETGKSASEVQDFSKILDDANKKINVVDELEPAKKSVEATSTVVDKSGANKVKTEETQTKDPVKNTDDRTQAATKIVEKAEKVKDTIKDSFELTDEEITQIMENLGITLQDLLNPDKLKDLMMEVSGAADSITLITDSELYVKVKTVMDVQNEALNEIAKEFGIDTTTVVEMTQDKPLFENLLIDKAAVETEVIEPGVEPTLEITTDANPVEDILPVTNPKDNVVEAFDNKEVVISDTTDLEPKVEEEIAKVDEVSIDKTSKETMEKPKVNQSETTGKEIVKEDTEDNQETLSKMPNAEGTGKGRNEGFENSSESGKREEFTNANSFGRASREHIEISNEIASQTEAVTTTTTTQVNNVGDIVETLTNYRTQDSGEIVSQVTESIRVNISQDVSSLEMALHPASLGTVNVQVTSNNGVITAQVLVENEAVKAALESQLLNLQDSFEAAGHKVEAVEVSIANYDLNKGMDQNQNRDNNSKDREDAFRVMGSRRRINLNNLEELDEDQMTEEETITRDMMERNGNTVDMTV